MNIEKIKTAVDNINEEYLLDAAEFISGKDVNMKNKKEANVNEVTLVEVQEKKSIGKVAKWLSVAAVFSFIVAGVTLIGITANNNQIGTSGVAPLDSKVESSETEKPSIENVISRVEESSVVEKTEEEILRDKQRDEVHAYSYSGFKTKCSIVGEIADKPSDFTKQLNYEGGKITINGNFDFRIGENLVPEKASFGYYVSINGVIQDLYVGDESIGKLFTHSNVKEEILNGDAYGKFSISFTPTISEADKDMEELEICLVHVKNPHYEVTPYYLSSGLAHINTVAGKWIFGTENVENFVEETDNRFVNYEKIENEEPNLNPGCQIFNVDGSPYEIKCDGTSVSVKTTFRSDAYDDNITYRILYLINGVPVTLSDGTPYIELTTEPCKEYIFDVVTIDGIEPYDTIDVIEFQCDGTREIPSVSDTFINKTIVPADYVRPEE